MAYIEVTLPGMGEGIIEATITRWLVEQNSIVDEDEPIVEIATDKVDSEIPSPVSGKILKLFFNEGETPKVGEVIAIISTNGSEDSAGDIRNLTNKNSVKKVEDENLTGVEDDVPELLPIEKSDVNKKLSPFIRYYAKQRGITLNELSRIKGTGSNGLVTKKDVLGYFKNYKPLRTTLIASNQRLKSESKHELPEYIPQEGEEVIEIDKTRKLIAEHMVRSVHEAPHVTSIVEADITHLVLWREKNKEKFLKENNIKLTYTPIITEIVVKALKEFPRINVSFQSDKLILKKYINIGIATALPDHNLVVPVIKDADKKNLTKLAADISELTDRARKNKLKPGETIGGTFTITNLGMVGNITGTPIINQPESAILAIGAIKKKPWVINVTNKNTIGIRDILTLSLSYDHRVIDGALGGAFLSRVGQLLETITPTF